MAKRAAEIGKTNVAVVAYLLLQDVDECIQVSLPKRVDFCGLFFYLGVVKCGSNS